MGKHICSACLHQKGEDFLFILSHTDFYCVFLVSVNYTASKMFPSALYCFVFFGQVYLILAAQLAVTISVVSVFTFA